MTKSFYKYLHNFVKVFLVFVGKQSFKSEFLTARFPYNAETHSPRYRRTDCIFILETAVSIGLYFDLVFDKTFTLTCIYDNIHTFMHNWLLQPLSQDYELASHATYIVCVW